MDCADERETDQRMEKEHKQVEGTEGEWIWIADVMRYSFLPDCYAVGEAAMGSQ